MPSAESPGEAELGRSRGRVDAGWPYGLAQVAEHVPDGEGVGEEGDEPHGLAATTLSAAPGADQGPGVEDPGQQRGPAGGDAAGTTKASPVPTPCPYVHGAFRW